MKGIKFFFFMINRSLNEYLVNIAKMYDGYCKYYRGNGDF